MLPYRNYIYDTPRQKNGFLAYQIFARINHVSINVPSAETGIVSVIKKKNYYRVIITNTRGKVYYYLSRVNIQDGSKILKGQIIGTRPGVISPEIGIKTASGDPIDPRIINSDILTLPKNAEKP